MTAAELAQAMPDVARHFWGEPNRRHSNRKQLRWGTNGARSVDVAKGTWFDHEANEGGGVVDLLRREGVHDPWDWLRENGFAEPRGNGAGGKQKKIAATYNYVTEGGALLYQVVRFEPKTFRQRRPDGKGGWIWNLDGVTRVLYRLPDLTEALALGRQVFVVEGEKDVETLAHHGIVATCNPGGAGKWTDAYAEHLAGADVIVISDNDAPGRKHAQDVVRSLTGKDARVRLLDLAKHWPGIAKGNDISDWLAAGYTREELDSLIEALPDYTQASDETPQHNGRILPGTEFADLSTSSKKVWLAHHLLAIGEISVWYGEPGSGKSVGIEDLGLHIAAGREWQGHQVKQCAVLYVALERADVVARRGIAWGIEHGFSRERLPFKVIRGPLDFRDPQTAPDIVATIEDLARRHGCEAGLIIVDTVSRALCGGDENSPKDMGALVANTSRIQSAIGVHIALTHHQPVDGKERMRGHGALLGAVDTTIHVVNKNGTRLAEVVKSSDHEEGQRIAFALKSVIVDQDDGYGDPLTAPVVIEAHTPTASKGKPTTLTKSAKIALNALYEALDEMGEVPPVSNHIPPATKAVTVDQWRTYAYRMGISASDEPRARQVAFQRAVESLLAAHAVGIWEPMAWVA